MTIAHSSLLPLLCLAPLALSPACDGTTGPQPATDAGTDGTPPVDPPPDAPPDAPAVTCAPGHLCLKQRPVMAGATIPNGRLVVAFYQFIDDIELDPHFRITYDVPFAGSAQTIDIPLADIPLPAPRDDFELCIRSCFDLADPQCDCPANQARALTAYVFVVADANGSGGIDPSELDGENIYGVGYMHLGDAETEYGVPNALDILFPEGIRQGLSPYRIIDGSPFDQLGIPAPNTVFELDVCTPASSSCEQLRFPNLT